MLGVIRAITNWSESSRGLLPAAGGGLSLKECAAPPHREEKKQRDDLRRAGVNDLKRAKREDDAECVPARTLQRSRMLANAKRCFPPRFFNFPLGNSLHHVDKCQ